MRLIATMYPEQSPQNPARKQWQMWPGGWEYVSLNVTVILSHEVLPSGRQSHSQQPEPVHCSSFKCNLKKIPGQTLIGSAGSHVALPVQDTILVLSSWIMGPTGTPLELFLQTRWVDRAIQTCCVRKVNKWRDAKEEVRSLVPWETPWVSW